MLLAGSSWYWWKLTLSSASHLMSLSAAVCAGGVPQAGALHAAGRLGKPLPGVSQAALLRSVPAQAAFPTFAALPFTHQEMFQLHRSCKALLPLVINLHAGLQGVAENRTGSRGVCLAPVQAVL